MKPIERILLIDDEEVDQRQYARIITRSQLAGDLITFFYADEALDFLLSRDSPEIDLIFLDINIPRMDGFEFLDALIEAKGLVEPTVIFMLSTSLDPADKARALSYEAVKAFIDKPLRLKDIEYAAQVVADHAARAP